MFLHFYLSILLLRPVALALSIPQHAAQKPLLPQSHQKTNRPASVILAFTQGDNKQVHHAEVPLRTLLPSGPDLPAHPDKMNIAAVVSQSGNAVSMKELGKVMCRVMPRFSVEEKAALASADVEKVWPWFSIRDEAVLFQHASSRWFLAGRAVASYECR